MRWEECGGAADVRGSRGSVRDARDTLWGFENSRGSRGSLINSGLGGFFIGQTYVHTLPLLYINT